MRDPDDPIEVELVKSAHMAWVIALKALDDLVDMDRLCFVGMKISRVLSHRDRVLRGLLAPRFALIGPEHRAVFAALVMAGRAPSPLCVKAG